MAALPQQPFYIQVTPQKVDYTDSGGTAKAFDLPLVSLPAGTVLFRGVKIPNPAAGEDVRYFYRDFLGDPEGKEQVCLKPTHNVFFYPFPYAAFGVDAVGKTFHSIQAVVLVNPVTVVCNISPAEMVRSDAYGFGLTTFPYKRCDDPSFKTQCHEPSEKELKALKYDNCVDPKFQQQTGVRGWMAIADLDSIKPNKADADLLRQLRLKKEKFSSKYSSMGKYLIGLEKRQPGLASYALAWMYQAKRKEDNRKQAGFPEIALYPYRVHPGDKLIKRRCASQDHALNIMEKEAALNNLNYLPLAAFTKDATIDMVNGHFSYECLGVAENSFSVPMDDLQNAVETRVREWLDHCQTKGLALPFYGEGKLSFDSRTGFYVFPQLLPGNLRVRLPEKDERGRSDMPYSFLAYPLDTEEAKHRVLTYMLMFRSFIPGQYMKIFGLLKKFGVPRAMVFNRPDTIAWIFEELGIQLPATYKSVLGRAAEQYKANTGSKSKKNMEAEAKAAAELALAVQGILPGDHIFYKIYKDTGEVTVELNFEKWKTLGDKEYMRLLELSGRAPTVAEKMEKQYKGKNVTLTPEARAPPTSPVTAATGEENIPAEVKGKRDYLFKDQIAASNLKFIQMDETAMYSVTDGKTAIEQTNIISKKLDQIFGSEGIASKCYITDGTANVGGNTISFGKVFSQVNSVEIAPLRATLLANNIMVARTQDNTTVHVADYTKIWKSLQQNVIFMDPPWGGTNYKSRASLDLFLGPTNVIDLIKEIVDTKSANLIAMKVPVNYNIDGLRAVVPGVEEIKMKKQNLLLIVIGNEIKPLGEVQQPVTPPYGGLGMWGAITPPAYVPTGYVTPRMGSTSPVHVPATSAYGAATPPLYGEPGSTTPPLYPAAGSTTPPLKSAGMTDDELAYFEKAKKALQNAKTSGEPTPSPLYMPGISIERMKELYQMAKNSTSSPVYAPAGSPLYGPAISPSALGGFRKTRYSSYKGKRSKTRKTSRKSNGPMSYARAFNSVWATHAKAQG